MSRLTSLQVVVESLYSLLAVPAKVALPFVGFGMAFYAVAKKLGLGAREVAATVATPAAPAGSAALTGQAPARPGEAAPAAPAAKDALAKEIEEKRARR